jgi:hypothetical protein
MKIRLTELRRIIRGVIIEAMMTRDEVEAAKDAETKAIAAARKSWVSGTQEDYARTVGALFSKEIGEKSRLYAVSKSEIANADEPYLNFESYHPSVVKFVKEKLENEESTYDTTDLVAISINVQIDANKERSVSFDPSEVITANQQIVKDVRAQIKSLTIPLSNWLFDKYSEYDPELAEDYMNFLGQIQKSGFRELERKVEYVGRGPRSSAHGTSPFADMGAGGSGFSSGGLRQGGGPGTIGGAGRTWSANDPTSLGMGARKKLS